MKRKLMSVLITMAILFSLAIPAVAAPYVPPVPAEDQQSVWQMEGFTSLEEYFAETGNSEAFYFAFIALPSEKPAWANTFAAQHPAEMANFNSDVYFAENFAEASPTQKAYMEEYGLSTDEEFRADMICKFAYGLEVAAANEKNFAEAQAARKEKITSLGGVPGKINVMLNDKCIVFPSGTPYIANGVTYAPAAILSKALGTAVKPNADAYAPLRQNAEAAGFDVLWDEYYQTVVLLDRNKIIAEANKDFSYASKFFKALLAQITPPEQSSKLAETANINLTLFNTLDGNKSGSLAIKSTAIRKGNVISGDISINALEALKLLTPAQRKSLIDSVPKKLTFQQILDLSAGLKFEFIVNANESKAYFRAPVLASFIDNYDGNSWICADMNSVGGLGAMSFVFETERPTMDFGSMLYSQEFSLSHGPEAALNAYENIMASTSQMRTIIGNERFTEQDGTLTYKLNAKAVNAVAAQLSGQSIDIFRTANFAISLSSGGYITASAEIRPDVDAIAAFDATGYASALLSFFDFRLKANINGNAAQKNMNINFHWKNQLTCDVSYVIGTQSSNTDPLSAPPEGAKIISLDELN